MSSRVFIPLSAMKSTSSGHETAQPQSVVDVHGEILQIPVVDADDVRPGVYRRGNFRGVMGLHNGVDAKGSADGQILPDLFGIQQSTDEQHRLRPQYLRLVNLVGIHRKIFAQYRNARLGCDLLQIGVAAQKPGGLRQHGNGRRPGFLIFPGNGQIGKICRNEPLAGGRLLHLTDKAHPRLG